MRRIGTRLYGPRASSPSPPARPPGPRRVGASPPPRRSSRSRRSRRRRPRRPRADAVARRRRRPPPPPRAAAARRRPSCSLPELASTRSPRRASSCAGAGAGMTRAGPRPSSSTCARWGCAPTADWRTLVAGSPARSATFTGAPGVAYVVRRGAPIGDAVFGPTASSTVIVPLDERDRPVKLSRGWRKQRRPGAWKGATARRHLHEGHRQAALHPAPRPRDRAPLPLRRPAGGLARRPPHRRRPRRSPRRASGRLRFRRLRTGAHRLTLRPRAAASRSTPSPQLA